MAAAKSLPGRLKSLFAFLFIGRYSVLWYFLGLMVQVLVRLSESQSASRKPPSPASPSEANSDSPPAIDEMLELREDEAKMAQGVHALMSHLPQLDKGWLTALRAEYEKEKAAKAAGTSTRLRDPTAELASMGAMLAMIRRRGRLLRDALPLAVVRLALVTAVFLGVAFVLASLSVLLTVVEFVFSILPDVQQSLLAIVQNVQAGLRYLVVLLVLVGVVAALRGLILLFSWLRTLVKEVWATAGGSTPR